MFIIVECKSYNTINFQTLSKSGSQTKTDPGATLDPLAGRVFEGPDLPV
jgi:hypothetical protein